MKIQNIQLDTLYYMSVSLIFCLANKEFMYVNKMKAIESLTDSCMHCFLFVLLCSIREAKQ